MYQQTIEKMKQKLSKILILLASGISLQRKGSSVSRMFHEVIQPGDLLHCDIGLNGRYVHLHTDMQWAA